MLFEGDRHLSFVDYGLKTKPKREFLINKATCINISPAELFSSYYLRK